MHGERERDREREKEFKVKTISHIRSGKKNYNFSLFSRRCLPLPPFLSLSPTLLFCRGSIWHLFFPLVGGGDNPIIDIGEGIFLLRANENFCLSRDLKKKVWPGKEAETDGCDEEQIIPIVAFKEGGREGGRRKMRRCVIIIVVPVPRCELLYAHLFPIFSRLRRKTHTRVHK